MKVLLSAYACEPGKGSEPEVGFRALLAAAAVHDVWLITRENNIPALEAALRGLPERERIHIEGLDVPGIAQRLKRHGIIALQWYYDTWQHAAARRALELDREVGFDVAHHITFATYWAYAGVAALGKPLVLGPLGGGVQTPPQLVSELGAKGALTETARNMLRRISSRRPEVARAHRAASIVMAQNSETAAWLAKLETVEIFPHATTVNVAPSSDTPPRRTSDVLFAGRLIDWKAPILAVRAFRHVTNPEARLRIYGSGPERARIENAIRNWGLEDRVSLEGKISREELLLRVGSAAAILHPALHDDSPLAVAEALSLGTPVVALAHGGPRELVKHWPDSPATLVEPDSPERTARAMAHAVDDFLSHPPPTRTSPLRPRLSFADAMLDAYDRAVAGIGRVARG
ncbi:MAG TPA: glycosyltransferase [Gemmatimonadaceae bacterium]|nr:glycosyltransferase [Gemmatimonadaceae bacterium]